jgi:hypothetical protein
LANQYQNQLLQGGPEAFSNWARPYETQFQEQTLPGIAERYAGLTGPMGNPANSSGFAQAAGGAASQFQSNLAGIYAQLQQHAAQQAFSQHNALASLGLSTQAFQNTYQPGNVGAFGNIASGFAGGIARGVGQNIGSNTGTNFMDMFRKGNQEDNQG